jgi:hypothetical protein
MKKFKPLKYKFPLEYWKNSDERFYEFRLPNFLCYTDYSWDPISTEVTRYISGNYYNFDLNTHNNDMGFLGYARTLEEAKDIIYEDYQKNKNL